jgi:hypothetical protein
MGMTVAHQDLSQLTPRMLGALSNVQTKVIFGVGRQDAEYFAKVVGSVDTEAVKRDPKTETQHELFSPLAEQWEDWVNRIRHQPPQHAWVATQDGSATAIHTVKVPSYRATSEQIEGKKVESLKRHGIPHGMALNNITEIKDTSADRCNRRFRAQSDYSW